MNHAAPDPASPVPNVPELRDAFVTPHSAVTVLVIVICMLAIVATVAGLFWRSPSGPDKFTSIHGTDVEIYGQGLYRYDSVIRAAGNRGADLLVLVLGVPLALLFLRGYRQGSLRGTLLLSGLLFWILYLYATLSLATAFNELFLVYVALFGASLYALFFAVRSINHERLSGLVKRSGGLRFPSVFLIVSGVITTLVWLEAPVRALLTGETPRLLEHSTTLVTHALDLAIIVPAMILCGIMIPRGNALAFVIGFVLIFLVFVLAPLITIQTAFQYAAGVEFELAAISGPILGFATLAVVAIWVWIRMLQVTATE